MVRERVCVRALAVVFLLGELDVAFALFAVFGAVAISLAGDGGRFGCEGGRGGHGGVLLGGGRGVSGGGHR